MVAEKLLNYFNREITLAVLVDWAENTFIDDTFNPDENIDVLNDILAYLAAAGTRGFPLTWELCAQFMERLGHPVKVVDLAA